LTDKDIETIQQMVDAEWRLLLAKADVPVTRNPTTEDREQRSNDRSRTV